MKVAFGDSGDPALIAASRSHGNLAEHAPIVLIMLGLLEFAQVNSTALISIAAVFVVARLAHAIGLHQPSEPGQAPLPRQLGVVLTWVVMLVLAALNLFFAFVP